MKPLQSVCGFRFNDLRVGSVDMWRDDVRCEAVKGHAGKHVVYAKSCGLDDDGVPIQTHHYEFDPRDSK